MTLAVIDGVLVRVGVPVMLTVAVLLGLAPAARERVGVWLGVGELLGV